MLIMKKILIAAMTALVVGNACADNLSDNIEAPKYGRKITDYVSVPKFGGYLVGSYKYSDQDGAKGGPGFDCRYVRLYVDGTILKDFKYRIQLEMNGSPHLKDFFVDWQHWKEFGVKLGQYKRCFTFENPYNPWDVGSGDYSQLTKKFSGMGDHTGEKSMGGRDLGIQVHGDAFPISEDKHRLLHYELGIYNGQGINAKDKNGRKDFIGTIQFQPIKNLYIGGFYWNGNTVLEENGAEVTKDRNRWGVGAKYETTEWSARAEYARDKDKADAWYATVGIPCTPWLKTYLKYDVYRSGGNADSMKSIYSIIPNFQLHKNLLIQLQYNYVYDKTSTKDKHYNEVWVETYVRF